MLNEELLEAWVGLTYQFKNSRMTKQLTYNEATVLLYAYLQYKENNTSISGQQLIQKTRMQKSLLNRTISSLLQKDLIKKEKNTHDAREILLSINTEKMEVFNQVHQNSLALIDSVIEIIGEDDAKAFIRIYQKLSSQ